MKRKIRLKNIQIRKLDKTEFFRFEIAATYKIEDNTGIYQAIYKSPMRIFENELPTTNLSFNNSVSINYGFGELDFTVDKYSKNPYRYIKIKTIKKKQKIRNLFRRKDIKYDFY